MGKQKALKSDAALICVVLILLIVLLYSGLRILESTVLLDRHDPTEGAKKTITVDGVEYFPRQDITVLMVLGIDKKGAMESSGYFRNDGDADVVMLLVLDEEQSKCDVLVLNRDTMLDMSVIGVRGEQAGTSYGQLALAYTYGSGMEDSCENVKRTVSSFLLGANIDYYVSMNMDAIAILNDAVGGVTVEVTEDFSEVDSTIEKGTITLLGQQAVNYLQTRKNVGDQLNVSRMERHKVYMDGFFRSLKKTKQNNQGAITEAYSEVQPYVVTDCSVNMVTMLMSRLSDYEFGSIYAPEGENVMGEEYYEFHVDKDDLTALTLKLFFAEK